MQNTVLTEHKAGATKSLLGQAVRSSSQKTLFGGHAIKAEY